MEQKTHLAERKYEQRQNELDYYRALHKQATGYKVNVDTFWLEYH